MAVEKYALSFGSVRPTPKGTYNPTLDYKFLNIVTTDDASYICTNRIGARSGTSLEDGEYWQLIARNGRDGAVTFATSKEYEAEATNKAVAPALVKPLIDEIKIRHEAFEKYGKAYDSYKLEGKTLENIITTALERIRPTRYVFTSNGSITAPSWAKKALITGCGGGGGGGSAGANGTYYYGGYGGWAGACVEYPVTITPGATYAITIGKAGVGSASANGTSGGTTSFGSLLSLGGGTGGMLGTLSGTSGTAGTSGAGIAANASQAFGTAGTTPQSLGAGTNGTGYGAPGGGSRGTAKGGNGTPGFLIIKWAE